MPPIIEYVESYTYDFIKNKSCKTNIILICLGVVKQAVNTPIAVVINTNRKKAIAAASVGCVECHEYSLIKILVIL